MDIKTILGHAIKQLNVSFKLNNKPITSIEIANDSSLLSSIMKRADQLSSFCLGINLGIKFNTNNDKIEIEFDNEVTNTLRILCAIEILIEIIETAPDPNNVSLDDLLYD